jgi:hypothetical protein
MAFEEVLHQIFGTGRHMDLCTDEVVNCGMGIDYVPNHRELMAFA